MLTWLVILWTSCLIIFGLYVIVAPIPMLFSNLQSFCSLTKSFHTLLMCSGTKCMRCWEDWRISNLTRIKLLMIRSSTKKVMVYQHLFITDIVQFLLIITNISSTNKSVMNHSEKWFPSTWLSRISHIHVYLNILIRFLVLQEPFNISQKVKKELWKSSTM